MHNTESNMNPDTPLMTLAASDAERFRIAADRFLSSPNPLSLLTLNECAQDLIPESARQVFALALRSVEKTDPLTRTPSPAWRNVFDTTPDPLAEGFREIRMVFDARLTPAEIERVSGCLGYALTETVKGEELSSPRAAYPADRHVAMTVLDYMWDSSRCIRTEPDFDHAFEVAARYVEEGTPVRTTDRAGEGTRGTRLVEGLLSGHRVNVTFYVK